MCGMEVVNQTKNKKGKTISLLHFGTLLYEILSHRVCCHHGISHQKERYRGRRKNVRFVESGSVPFGKSWKSEVWGFLWEFSVRFRSVHRAQRQSWSIPIQYPNSFCNTVPLRKPSQRGLFSPQSFPWHSLKSDFEIARQEKYIVG
jgi:hypothetical protein